MDLRPTERFSSRVEDYMRYRPSYPLAVVEFLARECGLTAQSRIADLGSGTGLLAQLFLDFGCEVFGVEPNTEMRRGGERILSGRPRFRSVAGRAEATTLPAGSVDFVIAGQAFHWFDVAESRAECRRILRPAGWVVLVWNERRAAPGFMDGYEDMVRRYGPEEAHVETPELNDFFGEGAWRVATFPNRQQFDLAGLRGRFLSSSYAPQPGKPGYEASMEDLGLLFDEYQSGGQVTLRYVTEVYLGKPRGDVTPGSL